MSAFRFLLSFGSLLFAYLPRSLQVAYQPGYYSDYAPVLGVQEVHIAQGKDPSTMVVSWLVPRAFGSPGATQVRYGKSADKLTFTATSDDVVQYTYNNTYTSGFYHHVPLTGLKPSTTYYYLIGDEETPDGANGLRYFTTLPAVGKKPTKHHPLTFGVLADLGLTNDSVLTVEHLLQDPSIEMILHAGDSGYVDCVPNRADAYLNLIQPLAQSKPWMVAAANHEVQYERATGLAFTYFINTYRMPESAPTQLDLPLPVATSCTQSTYVGGYNYGNSFFSYEAGPVHFIYLNNHAYINQTDPQYKWLVNDFASINRKKTPWVIVVHHGPWYNSNGAHQHEQNTLTMQANAEPLFYENNVNLVINGHVHAYERSLPVYNFEVTPDGPVYIVVGDAANYEGHASTYLQPAPVWSAYRNGTQFGHGKIIIESTKKLRWEWHRNVDGEHIVRDEITICNSALGLDTDCTKSHKRND